MARVLAIHQGRARPATRRDEYTDLLDYIRQRELYGQPRATPPLADMETAEWVRRGFYLSARYYCSCGRKFCTRRYGNVIGCPHGGQRLSVRADIARDKAKKLRVQYTVWPKTKGQQYMLDTYGDDQNNWHYVPGRSK